MFRAGNDIRCSGPSASADGPLGEIDLIKKPLIALLAIALLSAAAHAVFVLPDEITVAGRVDEGGVLRTDVVQDGVETIGVNAPVIARTGAASVSVTQGGTYTELGATCVDAEDDNIVVPAPVFVPALNTAVIGTYVATYTCTDSGGLTDTAQRIVTVGVSAYAGFGPQSSTKAAEWGFDFVEEFDGLADWNQSSAGRLGNRFDDTALALMPKLADGSTSAWGYFSLWGSPTGQPHNWIGTTQSGTRQVWRGTKSASIDIGETALVPSRLGLYFGATGYKDFSVFYMVYIPKNSYPTSYIDDGPSGALQGIGVYTEGEPYTYYNSWKFNTFNTECNSTRCPSGTYGSQHLVPHIKQFNYTPTGLIIQAENGPGDEVERATDVSTFILNPYMGQWFGVEFRINNNDTDTAYTLDIWVYDQAGNSTHTMQAKTFSLDQAAPGFSWDNFWFGGNNSNSWAWGPTMVSHYYVDDFIIDSGSKGRIGPRYFAEINN